MFRGFPISFVKKYQICIHAGILLICREEQARYCEVQADDVGSDEEGLQDDVDFGANRCA